MNGVPVDLVLDDRNCFRVGIPSVRVFNGGVLIFYRVLGKPVSEVMVTSFMSYFLN